MLKEHSQKTLVMGLGNPLSGDDGFGARVLARLRESRTEKLSGVSLADAHTDSLNHLDAFAGFERIVLVDAVLDPDAKLGPPGSIMTFDEKTLLDWPEASPSVHQVSPVLTVKLFRILHPEARPQIILVGLVVDRIGISPRCATEERIDEAAGIVLGMIR